jgi:hypothetical protein
MSGKLENSPANEPAESGWAGALLAAWTGAIATVMFWGYALSAVGAFGSLLGWLPGAVVAVVAAWISGRAMLGAREESGADMRAVVRAQPLLILLGLGVAAALAAEFLTATMAAPSNWDSITYHLTRVGYYLQQGSLADYGANFFAQEQHARGGSVVLGAIMALSGKSDRFVGLVQLTSYVMCMVAAYVLARQTGRARAAALAAAAMFGLLTVAVMEAPTEQDDLLIASFVGITLVGLVGYVARGKRSGLILGATGFAVALAVKASALTCVPGILIVAAFSAWRADDAWRRGARRAGVLALAMAFAAVLAAGPAGYWKNLKRFGNPLGGPDVTQRHTAPDANESRWHMGLLNLVRFAGDFCTLDGWPESWGGAAGNRPKQAIGAALKTAGLDAESPANARSPFSWSRPRFADENTSFFGWVGIALMIPGCLGALVRWRSAPAAAALALAFGAFFVGQAFAGPYDPWRGRHFIYGACFAAPAAVWLFEVKVGWLRRCAWGAAAIGAVGIVPAVLWRSPNPLLAREDAKSLFQMDRLEQMAAYHASLPAHRTFDRLVPPGATVIVALPENEYEYPLFGEKLSHRLIPYRRALEHPEIAAAAEYLVYDGRIPVKREPTDIGLGYRWALRKLPPGGRGWTLQK